MRVCRVVPGGLGAAIYDPERRFPDGLSSDKTRVARTIRASTVGTNMLTPSSPETQEHSGCQHLIGLRYPVHEL